MNSDSPVRERLEETVKKNADRDDADLGKVIFSNLLRSYD